MSEENNGQVPSVQAVTPQVGTPADPPVGETKPTLTLEQALSELEKVRREAAGNRVKLNEFESAQRAAEEAKLSEAEKLQKRLADQERTIAERDLALQEVRIARAVASAANKLGCVDSDVAERLLDASAIEYDADGKPQNIEALLEKLMKDKPYLKSQPNQRVQPNAGAPMNPSRNAAGGEITSFDQIKNMSQAEIVARHKEINRFYARQNAAQH